MEKIEKTIGVITGAIGIAFAILGVLLYFIGDMWSIAFAKEIGIQSGLFENSLEKNLERGYMFIVGGNLTIMYLVLTLFIAVAYFALLFELPLIRSWLKRCATKISNGKLFKHLAPKEEDDEPVNRVALVSTAMAFIFFGLTLFILMLSSKAQEHAKNTATSTKDSTARSDVIFLDDNTTVKGNIVACGQSHCAIYQGSKTITIPMSRVRSMESL